MVTETTDSERKGEGSDHNAYQPIKHPIFSKEVFAEQTNEKTSQVLVVGVFVELKTTTVTEIFRELA